MGPIVILPRTHFNLVPVGLDHAVRRAGENEKFCKEIQFKICSTLNLIFFRTDRFHSTNSILLLAGSFVSSLDLIYFYVHYSIRQFDGVRGRSNFIGAAWPTSWSRESSHSNKNHSSSQKLLDLKSFIQSVNFFSCFCLITLMSFWNMKKNVYVVVRMNSSNL